MASRVSKSERARRKAAEGMFGGSASDSAFSGSSSVQSKRVDNADGTTTYTVPGNVRRATFTDGKAKERKVSALNNLGEDASRGAGKAAIAAGERKLLALSGGRAFALLSEGAGKLVVFGKSAAAGVKVSGETLALASRNVGKYGGVLALATGDGKRVFDDVFGANAEKKNTAQKLGALVSAGGDLVALRDNRGLALSLVGDGLTVFGDVSAKAGPKAGLVESGLQVMKEFPTKVASVPGVKQAGNAVVKVFELFGDLTGDADYKTPPGRKSILGESRKLWKSGKSWGERNLSSLVSSFSSVDDGGDGDLPGMFEDPAAKKKVAKKSDPPANVWTDEEMDTFLNDPERPGTSAEVKAALAKAARASKENAANARAEAKAFAKAQEASVKSIAAAERAKMKAVADAVKRQAAAVKRANARARIPRSKGRRKKGSSGGGGGGYFSED